VCVYFMTRSAVLKEMKAALIYWVTEYKRCALQAKFSDTGIATKRARYSRNLKCHLKIPGVGRAS
jgi:hypothetical protein